MSDDSDPELLLASLMQRVPGARSAVLAKHGLKMAWHGLGNDRADELAAIASGLFSQARQAAVTFGGKDGVRQVVAELDNLILFAASAGSAAVLVVLAGRETDAAALGSEIGEVVTSVQPFLATQPRIRGAVTRANSQSRDSAES